MESVQKSGSERKGVLTMDRVYVREQLKSISQAMNKTKNSNAKLKKK
jgi:hypothetical protein